MSPFVRLSINTPQHNDKDPVLARDGAGKLWVSWQSYQPKADSIMARYLDGSQPGPALEISESPGINLKPAIAPAAQGGVWVAWAARRKGHWSIQARHAQDAELGPALPLAESGELLYVPALATDDAGNTWAAWEAISRRQRYIMGCRQSQSGWAAPIVLSHGTGERFRPTVCASAQGAWLAYEAFEGGQYRVYLRHWDLHGLSDPINLTLTTDWEMFPRLCPDGEGGVWAAWTVKRDVRDHRGIMDHKIEIMASHCTSDGQMRLYRNADDTQPVGYVTHLYHGLLGKEHYWGFIGRRRRPQVARTADGHVWLLYERKEDESRNAKGPDAQLLAQPLTGQGDHQAYMVDEAAYYYTINGDIPFTGGQLPFAGQIPAGQHYGDICAGTLQLDRSRPVETPPASGWSFWQPISLPEPPALPERPQITLGDKTYRLYWGDTHCHGVFSGDAEGEIDENYYWAREKSALDFVSITDNDFIYDDVLTPSAWAVLCAQAAHYDDPGRFLAISGYERSFREPIDGKDSSNHRIVLFPDYGDDGLYHHTESDADTEEKFVACMEHTDAFIYPHHPTWRIIPSSRLGGAEVCSSWDIYMHIASTIPQALQQGHRLAFIGSSDTHRIVPGMGGSLMGVWAEELTREAIFEALWARRCFATNGERLFLDVRANGIPMGAAMTCHPGSIMTITCAVKAPRTVQAARLFRDGQEIQNQAPAAREAELTFSDQLGPGQHYYYVELQLEPLPRVPMSGRGGNLQVARGDYAWSSPTWVDVEDA